MAMVVKNNMPAKNTLNQLDKNDKALAKSLKKAASGMKINGAGDDASGYAISERMDTQLRSLEQDNTNAQNGNSLLKTAEGAIASTVDILKTLKEKAINAANDTILTLTAPQYKKSSIRLSIRLMIMQMSHSMDNCW